MHSINFSKLLKRNNFEPLCERFNLKLPKIKITLQSILNVYFISNKILNTLKLNIKTMIMIMNCPRTELLCSKQCHLYNKNLFYRYSALIQLICDGSFGPFDPSLFIRGPSQLIAYINGQLCFSGIFGGENNIWKYMNS